MTSSAAAPPRHVHPRPGATALVVGATGIAGAALCDRLVDAGWHVLGLSRSGRELPGLEAVETVRADLTDADELRDALAEHRPTHVFLTAWARQDTEEENIRVNARHGARRARRRPRGRHGAPRRAADRAQALPRSRSRPTARARCRTRRSTRTRSGCPTPNFYYAQEDELFAAAERDGFTWSVHRAHTIIGAALGNAMNMGQTLAAYAAICRELDRPFVFPGSETQWNGVTDMTDAGLLAEQLHWAATTPAAADTAFNVANGDVFRWRWMWPRLAERLGVRPEGYAGAPRPLEEQMADAAPTWRTIAEREGLRETDVDRVASWWHTDGDLGREMECLTDLARSRARRLHRPPRHPRRASSTCSTGSRPTGVGARAGGPGGRLSHGLLAADVAP